ncbi:hypothetical protein VTN77DRAFT_6562 [Rasamsonia byssochlamydoides]|uniref:uncharacterized protein n=1 Tax=Rasamsonia byssochlamydoides TaxID=89139 RepID=UPI003742151A
MTSTSQCLPLRNRTSPMTARSANEPHSHMISGANTLVHFSQISFFRRKSLSTLCSSVGSGNRTRTT